ncbi:Fur family transcriptional regulator [[Clostridium] hylemonae]|uniref:Fur family transcriptional regulator n=1 Tax=[Clostridium] hylemonae TaxID=89153 RepID=UPI0011071F2F|nr:transcriptional repressor [[Clostridium] hylemonae]
MNQEERLKEITNRLKENGYRITSQRKMLLEVILSNEHSSCKEIYFAAKQIDNRLGIATVYRTVQLLEDLDLIRKEMAVQI